MARNARKLFLVAFFIGALTASTDVRSAGSSAASRGIAAELPVGWTMEVPDPNVRGLRFVSPDGEAWLELSKEGATGEAAAHMDAVADVDQERVTYLRRGRSWIVVSGFRAGRIFYRKAMLACANRLWHQIEFEYPASEKRAFDRLVTRISRALGAHNRDGCIAR